MSSPASVPEKPTLSAETARTVALVCLAAIMLAVAFIRAKTFFVPIALAIFLNTLFRPAVRKLEQARIPTPAGAAIVVVGALGIVAVVVTLLWAPGSRWIADAPARLTQVESRVRELVRPLEKMSAAADAIQKGSDSTAAGPTVTVTPEQPPAMTRLFGTTAAFIMLCVEVVLLLYLLLASGSTFLERLVSIIPGRADKRKAVKIATDCEAAVSRYLVASVIVNFGQGVVVALCMWALGMPDPFIWGALTFALEFIPFIGGLVMVGILLVSAVTTFDSVGYAILAPLAYLVISALQNNVASPMLYGSRLRLNPVAVLIAVIFWGYIWGVVGAFLAVPIVASVKVLCDHVETFHPVGKFLEA